MTVYAPSDVRAVSMAGGCGEGHTAGDLPAGRRFAVNCPDCEPLLTANTSLGWASTPDGVALTPDERAELDANKAAAERAQVLAMQVFGAQMANLMRSGALTPAAAEAEPTADDLTDADLEAMEAKIAAVRAGRAGRAPKPAEAPAPARAGRKPAAKD